MANPQPHTVTRETLDARYDALYLGEVVENVDPLGIGRVRVLIPGLVEPKSVWALPRGRMYGVKNGIWMVPQKGANVVVEFHQGDPDHPVFSAGPWGAPGGESDVPEQSNGGNPDIAVFRWRDFHVTFDGREGAEKLTVEDLSSLTKLEIDRTTGDYLRDVEGAESVQVAGDREVIVEQGDESHQVLVGSRDTVINQDDTEQVTLGNKTTNVLAGSEVKTIPLGDSTETVGLNKTISAGVAINIVSGGAVNVTAAGAVSIAGGGVSLSSGAGPTTVASGGLTTKSFLGGIVETVVGGVTKTITGAWTLTVSGVLTLAATILTLTAGIFNFTATTQLNLTSVLVNLGLGPIFQPLVNSAIIAYLNTHTHASDGLPPTQQILPGPQVPPNVSLEDVTTTNTLAS